MATTASEAWSAAQKIRQAIGKEIDKTKRQAPDNIDVSRLKGLEEIMAKYRLACIEILWLDIQYGLDQKVDVGLWQAHSLLNSTYRKLLGKLSGPQQVVRKRKIEKLYNNFLKVSQFFYKGYIQRLCARYDMPPLRRIAQSAQLEKMDIPEQSRLDPAATGIDKSVLYSCHTTLTYMGDLSRYRSLLRQQGRNFDSALTYYSLANDLVPDSGYGHHQMGLIYLEEKNHVEIVYHFYRALALEKPHPNAANNLEIEFRDLLRPPPPRAQSAYAAFASWFVKLHAYFYRGEDFPQRDELEEEVLHRLRVALTAGDFGPTLLKMVLINVCAYHVAQSRINSGWTDEGSRSCQFILRFNVRMIHTITHIIQGELVHSTNPQQEHGSGKNSLDSEDETARVNAVVASSLPLLRVYMAWLCSYRSDLIQFQDHLEPHIGAMYKTLSQVLTGIQGLFGDDDDLNNLVPYLLPEDIESLGLDCLHGPGLTFHCRLSFDAIQQKQKPRREEMDDAGDFGAEQTLLARALDITMCGMTLAHDDSFPFVLSKVNVGSRCLTQFIFLEDGGQASPETPGPTQNSNHTDSLSTTDRTEAMPDVPQPSPPPTEEPASHNRSPNVTSSHRASRPHETHLRPSDPAAPEDTDAMDSKVFGIVQDFLAPPELHKREEPVGGDGMTASYNISSSTARAFGSIDTTHSPRPGSAASRSFQNLPWNYFHVPTPQHPTMPGGTPTPGRAFSGPQSPADSPLGGTADSIAMQTLGSLDGPLARGSREFRITSRPGSSAAQRVPVPTVPQAWDQVLHRLAFSQPMSEPPPNPGGYDPQPSPIPSPNNVWAQHVDWGAQSQGAIPGRRDSLGQSNLSPSVTQARMANPPIPQMDASFSSLNFSDNTSSLPPVNSPRGLPQQARHRQHVVGSPIAPARSPAVALSAFPPSAEASLGSANYPMLYNNGHRYTAAAAAAAVYGRGHVAAIDERDYFQNYDQGTTLGSFAVESEAYDRRNFYGASQNDYEPR